VAASIAYDSPSALTAAVASGFCDQRSMQPAGVATVDGVTSAG
jgi:hypothetical protein